MREQLVKELKQYVPWNEQEEMDVKQILSMLVSHEDIFLRENTVAHMTASAWIVNEKMDQALMCYHNIYNSWSWLGGHADGEEDLLKVALKEASEESGIKQIRPYAKDIFSVESLTVDGHVKKGKYVSSHLHLNVTYLLIADETEMLSVKEDENSGVKWFSLEGAVESSTEPWFQEHIYKKLNEKVQKIKDER